VGGDGRLGGAYRRGELYTTVVGGGEQGAWGPRAAASASGVPGSHESRPTIPRKAETLEEMSERFLAPWRRIREGSEAERLRRLPGSKLRCRGHRRYGSIGARNNPSLPWMAIPGATSWTCSRNQPHLLAQGQQAARRWAGVP